MQKEKIKQNKQMAKESVIKVLVVLAIFALFIFATNGYLKQEKELERLNKEAEELALKLEIVEREAKQVDELKALSGSTDYIERVAREKLGLVRPDEIIFIER